jgi:hypothetical protein
LLCCAVWANATMDWGKCKYNGCLDAPETLAGVGFRRAFVEVLTDCSATQGCAVLLVAQRP